MRNLRLKAQYICVRSVKENWRTVLGRDRERGGERNDGMERFLSIMS